MKNISLYINQGSWLNKMHPYTKLLYILTAIMIPLTGGKLWLFPVMIVSSLLLLASGKILKRALPLVAFSFTLIVVIFLIQGLFNYNNETVLFSVGVITITDAQRSRGMETEGNLWVRIKAFLPLISPVVMSSLINTRERAIALDVRGFGRKQKKTWLYDRPKYKWDPVIRVILVVLMIITIVWRIL